MATSTIGFRVGRHRREQLRKIFGFLFLIPGLLWVLMPTAWMFSAAFSSLAQVLRFPAGSMAEPLGMDQLLRRLHLLALWPLLYEQPANRRSSVSIGQVISASLAGYAFARLRAPGRNFLFVIVLSTLMLPYTVIMIPQFVIFKELGWINTYKPLTIPFFGGGAFFIFLFRQFFRTIPEDIFEAARLDGCTYFGIYWRILMPLSVPIVATSAILIFQNSWQDLLGPLIYLNSNQALHHSAGPGDLPLQLRLQPVESDYGRLHRRRHPACTSVLLWTTLSPVRHHRRRKVTASWTRTLMDDVPGLITLSHEDRRLLASWTADCAERVLPLFEAQAPADTRPCQAIEGIRAYAREGKRTARLRALVWGAYAAAREVDEPAATAAARAPRDARRELLTCIPW